MSEKSGLSEAFLGLIILPIAGNACEHITAVLVAYKNKMDLAIGVALGSSIQIAIFVLPVLVLIGYATLGCKLHMSVLCAPLGMCLLQVDSYMQHFCSVSMRKPVLQAAFSMCLCFIGYVMFAMLHPTFVVSALRQ